MIFQVFPSLDQHFSEPVRVLLKRWSVEFFSHLPQSSASELSRRLLEGCEPAQILCASPVLSKLGQVLARDLRLEPEIREELQKLESSKPRGSYRSLRKQVASRFPSSCRLGSALAEGSLALVFPVKYGGRDGVAKILKPGIEDQLLRELRSLESSVSFLESEARKVGLPQLDYSGIVSQVREALAAELDLVRERQNLELAQEIFDTTRVAIPAPWDNSDEQVLVMDRLFGQPLQPEHYREAVVELLVKPLFNSGRQSLFHGDLHGGNLMSCSDGRIGVLDWGLCLDLSTTQRSQISRLTSAILFGRTSLAIKTLDDIGLHPGTPQLRGTLAQKLDSLLDGCQGEIPSWLLILRKTLHQLEGVLEPAVLEQTVLVEGLQQLLLEWPFRFFVRPGRRDVFGSHLSTNDLWSLILPV